MAICLKCGIILNDVDVATHVAKGCDPSLIPAAGTIKKPVSVSDSV
jgi:hypothetical protein